MLTWSIWISCPQLRPASFSRARLARPIRPTPTHTHQTNHKSTSNRQTLGIHNVVTLWSSAGKDTWPSNFLFNRRGLRLTSWHFSLISPTRYGANLIMAPKNTTAYGWSVGDAAVLFGVEVRGEFVWLARLCVGPSSVLAFDRRRGYSLGYRHGDELSPWYSLGPRQPLGCGPSVRVQRQFSVPNVCFPVLVVKCNR